MTQEINLHGEFSITQTGQRLDQALAELFPDYSRTRIKEWILSGAVSVDGHVLDVPRTKILEEQTVSIVTELQEEVTAKAQKIDLDIVYEDDHILVINKQAGLVVHPGAGNRDGTLMNALLHHCPNIEHVPRAGIVHRLDKDTTGLMVVAKTVEAQTHLVTALQARAITREYEAIALGTMTAGGLVDEPIGRHPTQRTQMAVERSGKPAVTHYRVAEKFRAHTRLRLRLESGRTHQIRVHMAYIGHVLVGDPVYGGRPRLPKAASAEFIDVLKGFKRQALHAVRLEFAHPITCDVMSWTAPIPDDMAQLTKALRQDTQDHPITY
ncbi:23S rRNA pseudouridine(1911/1915/1917) synthase RluD [Parashewanella spongiae]|uniref:Pseudouridine synthase n=1 Tax=Parashewanella spongiae TaxID=342950 RepID=A0A3A6UCC7_9GAMM|nr:23S rRNA pseudouridine(1911/1915/1917) synthase RluD [Parashewanella spongiae]MCL1078133.1 23S rRNA pseudouridine(1911/1915/1917) synthase RluD [Parashewanella spongiae]RJY16379.1 23S rRNA pseudouridine(1911/1915/1917) synthase RluD [Parashewanella spongiae]